MSVPPGSLNGPVQDEWTFALVDLAGFTALTELHGDELAADLAMSFADLATAHLRPPDRLVKTMGDAVLLASPNPETGLLLVASLLDAIAATPDFPVARAGLHHGAAVERGGDMFGAAINLTARVAAQAAGGQVLATAKVADAAMTRAITAIPLGSFAMRNVTRPVELWDLALHEQPAGRSIDPVCRMAIEHIRATGYLRHQGRDYWFCSLTCAETFARTAASNI